MSLVEQVYASAANAGLLQPCVWQRADGSPDEERLVGYSAPDHTLLDGLAVGSDHAISYPATYFVGLAARDTLLLAGATYSVREVRAVVDGSEMRATWPGSEAMADNSIRERILLAVMAAVRPAADAFGATLHRSPAVAVSREQSPALVVFPETDTITERANDRAVRALTVRIVALVRAAAPVAPDTEADRLLTAAHAALMADPNLGGFALGIQEQECEWEAEDADAVVASIPARYRISYRTLIRDLSIQG